MLSDEAKAMRRKVCETMREFAKAASDGGTLEIRLRIPNKSAEFKGFITELTHRVPPMHPDDTLVDVGSIDINVMFTERVHIDTDNRRAGE